MNEEKFSELVNLYLDKEISKEGIELLKKELERNPERKSEFQERCRLHQAMRLALGAPSTTSRLTSSSGKRSGSSRRRSSSGEGRSRRRSSLGEGRSRRRSASSRSQRPRASGGRSNVSSRAISGAADSSPTAHLPRWVLGAGLAACLTVGGLVLFPVFTDTTHISKGSLQGVEQEELDRLKEPGKLEEVADSDPLDLIRSSDLRRYAKAQQQREERRNSASLAAELRLLGMSPEMAVVEAAPLKEVSLASIQPRDTSQRQIEMLNRLEEYSLIPEHPILESSQPKPTRSVWPSGFQSSLASFK